MLLNDGTALYKDLPAAPLQSRASWQERANFRFRRRKAPPIVCTVRFDYFINWPGQDKVSPGMLKDYSNSARLRGRH